MALGIAALVPLHADAVAGLLRVSVVTHENDDCVFPKTVFLQLVNHLADVIISRSHNRTIRAAGRIFHILIQRFMLF